MERHSENAHLSPYHRDVLERLDRIIELLEAEKDAEWDVCDTHQEQDNPVTLTAGWKPFAVTQDPGGYRLWWCRRKE